MSPIKAIYHNKLFKSASSRDYLSCLEESIGAGKIATPLCELRSQFNLQIYHTTGQVVTHHLFALLISPNHLNSGIKPV
jgi:hypothetical protein